MHLTKPSDHSRISPQVDLGANEKERRVAVTVLPDLRHPPFFHVAVRVGVDGAEADEEDVSTGVGSLQTQPVEIRVNLRFQDILIIYG